MATAVFQGATGNRYIDGVLSGAKWSGSVTYSFPNLASDYPADYGFGEQFNDFKQVSAQQQVAIHSIMQQIANYTISPSPTPAPTAPISGLRIPTKPIRPPTPTILVTTFLTTAATTGSCYNYAGVSTTTVRANMDRSRRVRPPSTCRWARASSTPICPGARQPGTGATSPGASGRARHVYRERIQHSTFSSGHGGRDGRQCKRSCSCGPMSAGITFTQVNPGGTPTTRPSCSANYSDPPMAPAPSPTIPGSTASDAIAGDVWLNTAASRTNYAAIRQLQLLRPHPRDRTCARAVASRPL